MKSFDCAYLLRCFGAFFQEGSVRLVLEYMDCGCIESLINVLNWQQANNNHTMCIQIPLVPELVISRLIYQVLGGLQYLHQEKNQLHRDLKPGNVLINSLGQAKISDFGIAKEFDNKTQLEEFNWVYNNYHE